MWLLLLTSYANSGTLLGANTASRAFFCIDLETDQGPADTGRTFFVLNMSDILITEILEGTQNRIRSRAAQGAQGTIDDSLGHGLQKFNVTRLSLAFADIMQDFIHPVNPFPARNTLTAGFKFEEIDEIPRYIDHAGAFIHDNHTTRTHHGAGFPQRIKIHGNIYETCGQASA
jgi:hypothetical protein